MGFSVKWLHIFPIVRSSCEKQSQDHRIILMRITTAWSDLGPTWGSKLPFKRVNSVVNSPGNTELRNAGEETNFLSHWSCWYFSNFPLLHTGVSFDCSRRHTRIANTLVNSQMRKTKFHIPLLIMKARTGPREVNKRHPAYLLCPVLTRTTLTRVSCLHQKEVVTWIIVSCNPGECLSPEKLIEGLDLPGFSFGLKFPGGSSYKKFWQSTFSSWMVFCWRIPDHH